MTRKPGGYDPRREPDEAAPGEATNFRVDRVFVPGVPSAPRRESSPRMPSQTSPPPLGSDANETVALRRQLSRLQRQLADLQRELANKEDELAGELEKRAALAMELDEFGADLRRARATIDELAQYQARTAGVEERLAAAIARVEELVSLLEQEKAQHAATQERMEEIAATFGEARVQWSEERSRLDADHAQELAQLELQKRAGVEQNETALQAQAARLQEAFDEQTAQLKVAHERSLQALRGELEPKALEARDLAEQRERLSGELEALRAAHARDVAELEEAHRREVAQITAAHADDHAALVRAHAAELARVNAERDDKAAALEDLRRAHDQRESLVEQTLAALREAQKKLQLELAEAKEKATQLLADRASAEDMLTAATRAGELLGEDNKALRERLDAAAAEAKRTAFDRQRFAAFLEEGLAMLGALPPKPDEPDEPKG